MRQFQTPQPQLPLFRGTIRGRPDRECCETDRATGRNRRLNRTRESCAGSGGRLPARSGTPTAIGPEQPDQPEQSDRPRRCPFCYRWLGRGSTCTVCSPIDSPLGDHGDCRDESPDKEPDKEPDNEPDNEPKDEPKEENP
jgi:hypothetical protein